jgi:hypothetical protein
VHVEVYEGCVYDVHTALYMYTRRGDTCTSCEVTCDKTMAKNHVTSRWNPTSVQGVCTDIHQLYTQITSALRTSCLAESTALSSHVLSAACRDVSTTDSSGHLCRSVLHAQATTQALSTSEAAAFFSRV